MLMFLSKPVRVKFALASLSLFLVSQTFLPPSANAKQNFELPANSSLDDANAAGDTTGGDSLKPGTVLPPLTLTGDDSAKSSDDTVNAGSDSSAGSDSTDNAAGKKTYKLEESRNEFVPKGPAGEDSSAGLPSASLIAAPPAKPAKAGDKKKGKAGETVTSDNVYQKAKDLNVVPLPLTSSKEEIIQKSDQLENSEQKQIAQLWEATLQRSPDIQFVVQKLVPTSDASHTSTVMMRLVTSALYAGVGAFGTIAPGQSTYAMQNGAAQVLGQISGVVDSKNAKKAVLNQSELIALYQMVRNTADKMVDHYRDYKKNMVAIQRATADFDDLKAMAAESTARPLETEYTLRKQKRDIDSIADDVHRYRQNLIDLAGSEAVDKLDMDIARETQMLEGTAVVAGNDAAAPAKPSEKAIKLPSFLQPQTAERKSKLGPTI